MGLKQLKWPGHGVSDDQGFQYLDREYMSADREYMSADREYMSADE